MRILFLAHRIPYPPNKGDKIRSFHELEYLARRHDVWCACFVDDPADMRFADHLRGMCREVAAIPLKRRVALARGLAHLACGRTLTEGFYRSQKMAAIVRSWGQANAFDAVFVFSSGMATYGLQCSAHGRVIDFCDWDSLKWAAYADAANPFLRPLYRMEARRLAERERQWMQGFDASLIITAEEAAEITSTRHRRRLHVVRNGVDAVVTSAQANHRHVGFVGAMDYLPNVEAVEWFVQRVWPGVRAQIPAAVFRIIGRNPTPRVVALQGTAGVEVVGPVACAATAVAECAVHVTPMRVGRGIQNKVLEAMAAARPVVLTSEAARGINPGDGRECFIADDGETFASRVCQLLGDAALRQRMGQCAHAFVLREFDWQVELGRLEAVITQVARRRASSNAAAEIGFGDAVPAIST